MTFENTKIKSWNEKGYAEWEVEIETISDTLGTQHDTEADKCVFHRDGKGHVKIMSGWFYGVLRDSAKYLGLSPDGLVNSGMTRISEDIEVRNDGETSEKEMTGKVPGGRGTVTIHEVLPKGALIKFKVILPLITHDTEAKVREHLGYAGEYCGLGAWRKHGYGRFKVLKIKKIKDVKPFKIPKTEEPAVETPAKK